MQNKLRLNKIIHQREITQKDLADKLGVSKISVNNWCNNKNLPSIETLYKIATVLGVRVSDLLEETTHKRTNNK